RPRSRRLAGRSRGRCVLPLRLALGPRDARAPRRGLRRTELSRLLARVEPPRRAPARALGGLRRSGVPRLDDRGDRLDDAGGECEPDPVARACAAAVEARLGRPTDDHKEETAGREPGSKEAVAERRRPDPVLEAAEDE